MKKKLLLSTTLLIGALLSVNSCARPETEDDVTYWSNTTIEAPVEETVPFQYCIDMIEPRAYRQASNIELDAGSYISIIGMESGSDFWSTIKLGAIAAIDDLNEELGYTGSDKITFSYSAPTGSNATNEQINILDAELARFPVAMGISMLDTNAFEVQFDLALENAIPIIGYDSINEYDNISAMIATDNVEASITTASNLASMMNMRGDVLLLTHDSHSSTAIIREETIIDYFETTCPNINLVQTIHIDDLDSYRLEMLLEQRPELFITDEDEDITDDSLENAANDIIEDTEHIAQDIEDVTESIENTETETYDTSEDSSAVMSDDSDASSELINDDSDTTSESLNDTSTEDGAIIITADIQNAMNTISTEEVLAYILQKYDSVTGYITTSSDTSNTLISILDSLEYDYTNSSIVSFDADSTQLEHMLSGKLDGLLVQNPYGMGYATVIACARASLGLGNESFIDTGYTWVTQENIGNTSISDIFYSTK